MSMDKDKKLMSDYELRKTCLSKKIIELCREYLEDSGEDSIDVQVSTVDSTMVKDSYGKSCYGRVMLVSIDSWNDGDDDDE